MEAKISMVSNRVRNVLALALIGLSLVGLGAAWPAQPADVGVPGAPVPESPDFATLVLRDPWDMSQYSDVSQYLNNSGQQLLVSNPAVADGLFTGQSTGDISGSGNTARFFPLFPGYANGIEIGKIGARYPIDSAAYQCLYIAMQVNSHASNSFGPDQFRLFWFQDERFNGGGAQWGSSAGFTLYPEANGDAPTAGFRLYKVDLASLHRVAGNADWTDRATWSALRIDPTINSGINFAIDWVRLTNCAANNQNFTWTSNSDVTSLWLELAGTSRYIRVASTLNGTSGAGTVDLQGVPPGTYTAGVGADTTCCVETSSTPLVINQTPIVEFVRPSFHSGQDYATQAGGPWNFDSPDDINRARGLSASVTGGLLDMTTASGPVLSGGTDAQFYMRAPQPFSGAAYRYISFRLLTEWLHPWQDTPDGMIARLTWVSPGTGGAGSRCYAVSQFIPLDVGWQTYWVDLSDAFNGTPVGVDGACPGGVTWNNSTGIIDLRFDPNENVSEANNAPGGGGPFHQQMDWMRLTGVDHVTHGTPFPIELSINRDVSRLLYYYTTDPTNAPTQSPAQPYSSSPPTGPFFIYLPVTNRDSSASTALAGLPVTTDTFDWDTTSVAPNTYYICAKADGGGNTATYCSEAPVVVN
jgi:hypothetical protein